MSKNHNRTYCISSVATDSTKASKRWGQPTNTLWPISSSATCCNVCQTTGNCTTLKKPDYTKYSATYGKNIFYVRLFRYSSQVSLTWINNTNCQLLTCKQNNILQHNQTTLWAIKNMPLYFCPYLHKLLTNFQNSFTGTLCRQFAIMWLLLYSPPQGNAFLHYLVKYKCKQKITIITKI